MCNCDDLLICKASDNLAKHLLKLTAVLDTLREHDLLIKGSKIELFRSQLGFLGFNVSTEGWSPTESKLSASIDWPAPETVKHLRSFLGMANFFRSIMPAYLEMAAPLTDLLMASSGAQNVNWSVESETTFNSIKSTLTSAPVLKHFDPAPRLRTAVHVNGN